MFPYLGHHIETRKLNYAFLKSAKKVKSGLNLSHWMNSDHFIFSIETVTLWQTPMYYTSANPPLPRSCHVIFEWPPDTSNNKSNFNNRKLKFINVK